jgi:predicted porin
MKKLVLATILVAASLTASAQVAVYGLVREYVDNTKVGAVSVTSMVDDTSRIGFKATETLGSGLSARVVVETGFSGNDPVTNADTKIGNRQSTIGLATKNGSVDLGRKLNSHFLAITSNDVFDTDYGSIAGDIHNVRTVRSGNAVFLNYNLGPASIAFDRTVTGGTEATSYSGTGKLGPVSATVARFEQGSAKSTVLAAQGAYAGNKLFASTSLDTDVAGTTRGTLVGLALPVSGLPLILKGSYGVKTGDIATRVTAYAVGAEYDLSKRTSVNVAFRNVNDTVDTRQFGLGLSHSF